MNCPNTAGDLKYFDKFISEMPEYFSGNCELDSFAQFVETSFVSMDVHVETIEPMEIDEDDMVFKALEDELYETGFVKWSPEMDLYCYEEL